MNGESVSEDQPEVRFDFVMPPEWEVGVYANIVNVWHSPYEFTLDWAVTSPAEPQDPDDPAAGLKVPAAVARDLPPARPPAHVIPGFAAPQVVGPVRSEVTRVCADNISETTPRPHQQRI